ncbi:MAG TPA: isoprenylcysteine carboxylmethyltransferase family protein [Terriglobales bacterium]
MADWSRIARRVRVPLGFAFAVFFFFFAKPTWRSILLALPFILLGLIIRASASGHVRKNEELTTTGPYAYTRNPLYLGSLVLAAGFLVAARNWWITAVAIAIFCIIYIPVIRSEASFLRIQFPEYDEYARNVPVLLPRMTAFRHHNQLFSWSLYWKHREYNAATGAIVMLIALAAKCAWSAR